MFTTYILQSFKDNGYYIGQTNNLEDRLLRHNSGQVVATKHRRPFKLVYSEAKKTRLEAVRRELEIKAMKEGIQFKNLIR